MSTKKYISLIFFIEAIFYFSLIPFCNAIQNNPIIPNNAEVANSSIIENTPKNTNSFKYNCISSDLEYKIMYVLKNPFNCKYNFISNATVLLPNAKKGELITGIAKGINFIHVILYPPPVKKQKIIFPFKKFKIPLKNGIEQPLFVAAFNCPDTLFDVEIFCLTKDKNNNNYLYDIIYDLKTENQEYYQKVEGFPEKKEITHMSIVKTGKSFLAEYKTDKSPKIYCGSIQYHGFKSLPITLPETLHAMMYMYIAPNAEITSDVVTVNEAYAYAYTNRERIEPNNKSGYVFYIENRCLKYNKKTRLGKEIIKNKFRVISKSHTPIVNTVYDLKGNVYIIKSDSDGVDVRKISPNGMTWYTELYEFTSIICQSIWSSFYNGLCIQKQNGDFDINYLIDHVPPPPINL